MLQHVEGEDEVERAVLERKICCIGDAKLDPISSLRIEGVADVDADHARSEPIGENGRLPPVAAARHEHACRSPETITKQARDRFELEVLYLA